MPLLTWRAVEAHRPKAEAYKLTLDRGLQLRIAPDGKRTLLVRYTVKGSDSERKYRLPQEYGDAPGQLKLAAACAEAGRIRALARQGVDWTVAEDTRLEAEAATRAAALQRRAGPTLEAELRAYVEKKRRVKDGLPLKARTKSDYLAAIEPPRVTKGGTRRAAGPLHPIAHKPLATLTASDIRATYEAAARRSVRRAEYAMQILRAVLRWNGVVIPGNPLGRETAGRDRITITAAKGDPVPIPPELLGARWRAAERAPSPVAADYYRFQLLTGCRGVEIHGHKLHGYPPIRVGDVDHRAGRVLLRDTKNRSDHKLLLSRQALEPSLQPLRDSSMVARSLLKARYMMVGAPHLKHGIPVAPGPADFPSFPAIGWTFFPQPARWTLRHREHGEHEIAVDVRFTTDNLLLVREAALAGVGVAQLPYPLCRQDIDAGRLRMIAPEWSPPRVSIYVLYPSRRSLTLAGRKFIDALGEGMASLDRDQD